MGDVMRPDLDVGTTQALPAPLIIQPELLEPQAPLVQQGVIQPGAPVLLVTQIGRAHV